MRGGRTKNYDAKKGENYIEKRWGSKMSSENGRTEIRRPKVEREREKLGGS